MPVTQFFPSKHGFRFSNNDLKLSQNGGFPLCGGMAYAAIDYFVHGFQIPHDLEAPPEDTPLNDYLFKRQAVAHISTSNKFVSAFIPIPVVSEVLSGFSLIPERELETLKTKLSTGRPAPVCLANPGFDGHHVVAMGCNPAGPITITIYDPNAPGRTGFIVEFTPPGSPPSTDSSGRSGSGKLQPGVKFVNTMNPSKLWQTFFVDTFYIPAKPDVPAGQAEWRWCTQCMGLFFNGHATKGACPKTGGNHSSAFSGNYWLTNVGDGQSNWRWCRLCEGLFFAGNNTFGVCQKNS